MIKKKDNNKNFSENGDTDQSVQYPERFAFSEGVIHRISARVSFEDLGLYQRLSEIATIQLNGLEFSVSPKKSGLYDKDRQRLPDYILKWEEGLQKITLQLSPRFEGMMYMKDEMWKDWDLRSKEAVGCRLDSSGVYPPVLELVLESFGSWNRLQSKLVSFEVYLRYDKRKETKIAATLDNVLRLFGTQQEYKYTKTVEKTHVGFKMFATTTNRFKELGFHDPKDRFYILKTYRTKHDTKDAILQHPKLEIALSSARSLNSKRFPNWSEWRAVHGLCCDVLANVCYWSGVSKDELIEDDLFKIREYNTKIKPFPLDEMWNSIKEEAMQVLMEVRPNSTKRKFLELIARQTSLDTEELSASLGIGRRQVFRIIKEFEERGILTRYKSSRTFVEFKSMGLREEIMNHLNVLPKLEKWTKTR